MAGRIGEIATCLHCKKVFGGEAYGAGLTKHLYYVHGLRQYTASDASSEVNVTYGPEVEIWDDWDAETIGGLGGKLYIIGSKDDPMEQDPYLKWLNTPNDPPPKKKS